jgi:hypothetical protein
VQLPFGIVANRSGELEMYRGFSTDMGEGGIGGKVDGELVLSEFVLLQMSHSPLGIQLDPRAQVRYRNNEIYGFEFLDIAPEQRGVVRRFCKLLGSQ